MGLRTVTIIMRSAFAVATLLVGFSVFGAAQQQQHDAYKVKHTNPEKAPKKSNVPIKGAGKTTSSANAKDLKSLEHQSAKSSGPSKSAGKKSPQLKSVKDKPNPPINFGSKGAGKNAGLTKQAPNPYKGRLKQKHSR
jgi:hypothetical protein